MPGLGYHGPDEDSSADEDPGVGNRPFYDSSDDDVGQSASFGGARKRQRLVDPKEDAMLGVFADEEEDRSGLQHRNIRYRGVNFVQHGGEAVVNETARSEGGFSRSPTVGSNDDARGKQPAARGSGATAAGGRQMPKLDFNTSGLGAKLMEKLGYKSGQGLGSSGQGILNPVETKLRPERAGLGAIREKTQQAKDEARRKGHAVSDDESSNDERPARPAGRFSAKKTQQRRPTVRYKTSHDIEEATGGAIHLPKTLSSLIDMTGPQVRQIEATSGQLNVNTDKNAGADSEIVKLGAMARRDVEGYMREWEMLQQRKKYVNMETDRLAIELDDHAQQIRQLEAIVGNVRSLIMQNATAKAERPEATQVDHISRTLEQLQVRFKEEGDDYQLDEVAVAALAPHLKRALADWDPLQDPFLFREAIQRSRKTLKIRPSASEETVLEPREYEETDRVASFYESFIYWHWLPKVRSVVNNDWDVYDSWSLLAVLDAWSDLIPPFVYYDLLEQSILPKLRKAIANWNPRHAVSGASKQPTFDGWLFPWLSRLGNYVDEVLDDVQRKISAVLSRWSVARGPIGELDAWKEALGKGKLERLLVQHIMPKLAHVLRNEFVINPADQQMQAWDSVIAWSSSFRPLVFAQLLESEFFPQWLNVLHLWLTSGHVDFEHVTQWYQWWQSVFPDDLVRAPAIQSGFHKGLDMMNRSLDLGDEAATKLEAPVTGPTQKAAPAPAASAAATASTGRLADDRRDDGPSFRDVVESLCAEHDLLLIATRKAHASTGEPMYRITSSPAGTGGVLVYFSGDVVWAQESRNRDKFRPVSLQQIFDDLEAS